MSRVAGITIAVLVVGVVWAAFSAALWTRPPHELRDLVWEQAVETRLSPEAEQRVEKFCSACHVPPQPTSYRSEDWHHEVMQAFHFYAKSGRHDLDPPPPADAIAYFRSRAHETLQLPDEPRDPGGLGVKFRQAGVTATEAHGIAPAIANVQWIPQAEGAGGVLIGCDMRLGDVFEYDPAQPDAGRRVLARLQNPCRAAPCDLDGDGQREWVVADLGSYNPVDHQYGRAIWLRRVQGEWQATTLLGDIGRVTDVRPADFDGDGDEDLVVGEFGWHKTGGVHVLRNQRVESGETRFVAERLDDRPGATHLPCHDLDGDGRLDIVALLSQEHERVEAYLNRGDRWERHTLWKAPDPAYGLSGMELVDFDGDGDLDALLTNGDTFDSGGVKPHFGVQWLENLGMPEEPGGPPRFEFHRLCDLAGAYAATAIDVDRDGDLDVLACVWLGDETKYAPPLDDRPALVCLERQADGGFARHVLRRGRTLSPTLAAADFDGDGDVDIALGHLQYSMEQGPWLTLWWQE